MINDVLSSPLSPQLINLPEGGQTEGVSLTHDGSGMMQLSKEVL